METKEFSTGAVRSRSEKSCQWSRTVDWRYGRLFFSSRRRHTRYWRDWSSDVCSSDLAARPRPGQQRREEVGTLARPAPGSRDLRGAPPPVRFLTEQLQPRPPTRVGVADAAQHGGAALPPVVLQAQPPPRTARSASDSASGGSAARRSGRWAAVRRRDSARRHRAIAAWSPESRTGGTS